MNLYMKQKQTYRHRKQTYGYLLNCGVGEDSLESLGLQGEKPIHSKGDQSWVFFGRTDTKAETPILWPPHAKS